MTRRDFARGAAALAAAGAPALGFPAIVKRRNLGSMLSHACVGTANMAGADLNEFRSHPDLHVTALCDVDETYLKKAAKLCPDARLYRNAHEMLEKEGDRIDSVNVSTPDHTHAEYILDALARGKNVYSQKPLCHDLADCRRIEALAAEKVAVTQLGTQIAAWECDRQAAQFIKDGAIGDVVHVWLFSNGGGHTTARHDWPLEPTPVPETLDWKTWLGKAPFRPYVAKVYHPGAWRHFREFGTSWLGDLGLHLLSPIWIGSGLEKTGPVAVTAEAPAEPAEVAAQYWPKMSHVTWEMPGVKSSGGKPFVIEWCDGNLADPEVRARTAANFLPPPAFAAMFARTAFGEQPRQGRVVEGTDGWLLSTHWNKPPVVLRKDGRKGPDAPYVGPAKSHYHEFVDCCLQGGATRTPFAWAGRFTEMVLLGNAAMTAPGRRLSWDAEKGAFA